MRRSDIQELLTALYLRLNGYFLGGFIAHAAAGNRTEIDILGVRFPRHAEPEREVGRCKHLRVDNQSADFVIGAVKGGAARPRFNSAFWMRRESITLVLNRIGAFSHEELTRIAGEVGRLLDPSSLGTATDFPQITTSAGRLRFLLFAADRQRV